MRRNGARAVLDTASARRAAKLFGPDVVAVDSM
jgi:hypothetical protein